MNKTLKLIITVLLFAIILFIAIIIPPKKEIIEEELLNIQYDIKGNETSLKYETENPVVALYVERYGSIVIELYPEIAPNTVNNYISLVKKGFYDNNTIHRLQKGFVLQGGDPTGTGSGGPGYTIAGEFTDNGYENNLSHEKWVVSMARSSNSYDTAGSQFFICLEDDRISLDNQYASFGKVIDGFATIEKIAEKENVISPNPGKLVKNLVIKKALVDLKGKEYPEPIIIEK